MWTSLDMPIMIESFSYKRRGEFEGNLGSFLASFLARFWIVFGSFLACSWLVFGSFLSRFCLDFVSILSHFCSLNSPKLSNKLNIAQGNAIESITLSLYQIEIILSLDPTINFLESFKNKKAEIIPQCCLKDDFSVAFSGSKNFIVPSS